MRSGSGPAALRFAGRYLIATLMIPIGVALGVCGLLQFAWHRRRRARGGTSGEAGAR
jgi:hypothetical protein